MAGKSNRFAIYVPTAGGGSAMEIFRPGGMGDTTESRSGGRSVVFINGVQGDFVPYDVEDTPPGDLPNTDITFFISKVRNFFELSVESQQPFHMQKRYSPCASIDNPSAWRQDGRIWHYPEGKAETRTVPVGPELRASGVLAEFGVHCSWMTILDYIVLALGAVDIGEANHVLCIAGIPDSQVGCGSGYPGPDKLLVAGMGAQASTAPNVRFSLTGGATWTVMTNSPFAATTPAEVISTIDVRAVGNGFEIIVGRGTTDAAAAAEIGKAVVSAWDATTIAAATWTNYDVGSTNAEYVTAQLWPTLNELYVGLDSGDIHLSEDRGETFSEVGALGNDVAQFAQDADGGIWAVGAGGEISYKGKNDSGFSSKTPPAGIAACHSINIDNNGVLILGADTKLFKSTNKATTAGAWETLKDFGASKRVTNIKFEGGHKMKNGDAELMRIFVDDTTPGAGATYDSVDGGNSFDANISPDNDGYNDVYQKSIGNGYVIAGDIETTNGVVHLMQE